MANQFIPDSVAHHFRASTSATVRKGVVKILAEKKEIWKGKVSQCSALTFDQDVFCEALFYHGGWITQLNLLKEKRTGFLKIHTSDHQTDRHIKTPTYCILGSCSL